MAWQDQYSLKMIITTGDGISYPVFTEPKYSKEIEYNGTAYSFVDIDGQLIDKKKLLNREFNLDFYFIGDAHLDDSQRFENSTKDKRPWTIDHPYYGTLLVQVLGKIKFDDNDGNVTRITCTATETITNQGITVSSNPVDTIKLKKTTLDSAIVNEPTITPTITETNTLKQTTTKNYKEGTKIIKNPVDAENYFNIFHNTTSAVNSITAQPLVAMQAIINVINAPANFETAVTDRVKTLLTQFGNLRATIIGVLSLSSKQYYQAEGAALISATALAAVGPQQGNYSNATVAAQISLLIQAAFRTFQNDINALQGANGGTFNAFIPSFNIMFNLADVINFTVANLYQIALAGRKQYFYTLPEDSNVFLLTHKFYKLDPQDNNLSEFISNNNFDWKQIALGISKGTTVTYYA